MNDNVKPAVYYDYEGETLLITRDDNNIQIETYKHAGGKDDGLSLFIKMTRDDWFELVKQVREL